MWLPVPRVRRQRIPARRTGSRRGRAGAAATAPVNPAAAAGRGESGGRYSSPATASRFGALSGAGNITVHGKFFERESPGIVGPKVLWVSSQGEVAGCIQQAGEPTRFGFERGCRLRVRILRANEQKG